MKSIRWRITIPYVVMTMLIMLVVGLYLSWFIRNNYLNRLEKSLTKQAMIIGNNLVPLLRIDPVPADHINQLSENWSEIIEGRVTIIGIDGIVIGESDKNLAEMDNHLLRPEIQRALVNGQGSSVRYSATLADDLMYVAVRITDQDIPVGFARIALTVDEVNSAVQGLLAQILITTIAGTVLITILSFIITRRVAKPIEELTITATELTHMEYSIPMPSADYDEIWKLSEAINHLVSELRHQIQALETEKRKLSSVLDQMTDGVVITDDNSIVEMVNPMTERLFEIEPGSSVGQSLIQALRHHQIYDLWKSCKETGQELSLTFELFRKGIFILMIVISLAPALPGKYLILFQDLTRMRRFERMRRDFISNISHELRTPLATLKALTETLQVGALDDPPAAKRFLSQMELEVDALTQMVSELLELTRIESGQVPLELKSVSPSVLIQTSIDRLMLQAERADLVLNQYCQDDLPNVIADPPRLGQALVNLLHNAIKFTPEGGKINVAAWQQGRVVIFAVEDTGVGIPSEDLPRIFERFYKADRARSGGGTGLGLAIARHLVEAHGGRIWVESQVGVGSTFSFSIPAILKEDG